MVYELYLFSKMLEIAFLGDFGLAHALNWVLAFSPVFCSRISWRCLWLCLCARRSRLSGGVWPLWQSLVPLSTSEGWPWSAPAPCPDLSNRGGPSFLTAVNKRRRLLDMAQSHLSKGKSDLYKSMHNLWHFYQAYFKAFSHGTVASYSNESVSFK